MNRWLILFCAFLLFAGLLIGENKITVEKLAAECSAGNQEACKDLADIAKNDKDSDIREAAVRKLTDQAILAKIALEDSDVGYTAIKNLADQSALAKAATDDKDWRVRLIFKFIAAFDPVPLEHREHLMEKVLPAIQILSYPAVVSAVGEIESIETEWDSKSQDYREGGGYLMIGGKIGEKKGEIFTCSIEVRKLSRSLSHTWSTDFPEMTSYLGFEHAEVNAADLLRKPFEKLTDQAVLADIARNHRNSSIGDAAFGKLTDQALLADIAKNDDNEYIRMAAVEKLTDQALLADIAKNVSYIDVREAAVEKLMDQTVLAFIAKNDKWYDVRKAAVMKLTDQALLAEIARNDEQGGVRMTAVKKLPANHPLRRVVLASEEDVKRITDQTLLADIAKSAAAWQIRRAAVKMLTDQAVLADIARTDQDSDVRQAAVEKLTDEGILAGIAKKDKNENIREAAERRLKKLQGK